MNILHISSIKYNLIIEGGKQFHCSQTIYLNDRLRCIQEGRYTVQFLISRKKLQSKNEKNSFFHSTNPNHFQQLKIILDFNTNINTRESHSYQNVNLVSKKSFVSKRELFYLDNKRYHEYHC